MKTTVEIKINEAEQRVLASIREIIEDTDATIKQREAACEDACTAVSETFAAVRTISKQAGQLEEALRVLTGYVESVKDPARPIEWAKIARALLNGRDDLWPRY